MIYLKPGRDARDMSLISCIRSLESLIEFGFMLLVIYVKYLDSGTDNFYKDIISSY